MSLADRLRKSEAAIEVKKKLCPMGKMLAGLDDEDRVALQKALNNGLVSASSIIQDLRAEGFGMDRNAISLHRRGECRCE